MAEILRPLKVGMVIQKGATVRSLVLDAAITKIKSQYWNGKGPIPDSVARCGLQVTSRQHDRLQFAYEIVMREIGSP